MLSLGDFIQVYVFTTNHHLNVSVNFDSFVFRDTC